MSEQLRIGVLGLSHDHVWDHLPHLAASDTGRLVAVADPNTPLLDRVKADHEGVVTYDDYHAMLDAESLDGVYIFDSNKRGAELAVEALNRGLHVIIEKPMAATKEGADAMLAAANASGKRLMVNWPFAWWPQMQHALRLALAGEVGPLWQVRYRAAHQGPRELGCSEYFCEWLYDAEQNGAGALMDYCCYGAALANVLLGKPSSVIATRGRLTKTDINVEDNAVIVMRYPKAMALAEASWSQIGKLTGYITAIYGTTGTLMLEPRLGGRLLQATAEDEAGSEVPVPEPEAHLKNATEHFLWAITNEGDLMPLCDPTTCADAQTVLSAAIEACDSGALVSLD
ncbi:MAG: Gfo/Idh/MocA family protein [Planctomycetota bacterium]